MSTKFNQIAAEIVKLDDEGLTINEIAETVGWPRQDVEKVLVAHFYDEDNYVPNVRTARKVEEFDDLPF